MHLLIAFLAVLLPGLGLLVGLGLADSDRQWQRHTALVRSHRALARLALPAGMGR